MRFAPDPSLSHEAMERLQREVADAAVFADDLGFDPEAVRWSPVEDAGDTAEASVVVGVDQAFREEEAVSAVVACRDGAVIERATGRAPLDMPYVPGLLSFREMPAIVDALGNLAAEPDLLVVDGSGRIHFRQAGIATHLGVALDYPAVGVAKNLLCGELAHPIEGHLAAGERVPVLADDSMDAPDGETVGYAYQSRQYPNPETRHVNPLYVSPGHRVSAETTVELVASLCAGYKLPEPTRLADAYADEAT